MDEAVSDTQRPFVLSEEMRAKKVSTLAEKTYKEMLQSLVLYRKYKRQITVYLLARVEYC